MSTIGGLPGNVVADLIMSLQRPDDIVEFGDTDFYPGAAGQQWPYSLSKHLSHRVQGVLLLLHFLFPHELLPALDLLDRKLVVRLVCSPSDDAESSEFSRQGKKSSDTVSSNLQQPFYVQSASAVTQKPSKSSKYRRAHSRFEVHYEVRLDSWNCTCPAFVYSTLVHMPSYDAHSTPSSDSSQAATSCPTEIQDWEMGGSLTSGSCSGIPMCKHILATSIGNAAPSLIPDCVRTSTVDQSTVAGWAAGWEG